MLAGKINFYNMVSFREGGPPPIEQQNTEGRRIEGRRKFLLALAGTIVGGAGILGCEEDTGVRAKKHLDKKPVPPEKEYGGHNDHREMPPAMVVEKIEAEKEEFLNSDVLSDEMEQIFKSERAEGFRADLERIKTNERVINWVVQYGSLENMKEFYDKVLNDAVYREQVKSLIEKYCRQFNVPFSLAYSIAAHEGHFDMKTKSDKGAGGIFQVMAENAAHEDFQASETASPLENNIYGGIRLLRKMYDRYHQWSIALMAYCQGDGGFERNLLRRTKKERKDGESWSEFLEHNNMNVLTLYSKRIKGGYGLGTQFPFQYPFYVLSTAETGRKIMSGEYRADNIPPVCTNKEVCAKMQSDETVVNRIIKKKYGEDNWKDKKFRARVSAELSRAYCHN